MSPSSTRGRGKRGENANSSRLHYCLNGFQLTNALFLCRSLCVALRLTKDAAGPHDSTALERMRAFAGCYFLNTL